jgi:hypothetical protein
MIEDGFEHICDGCFTIIAPCDPHAYRKGAQFFHSLGCEERMQERSYALYLKSLTWDARQRFHRPAPETGVH